MCVWRHSVERLRERGGELARIRTDCGKFLRSARLLDEPITVRRQFEEPLVDHCPGTIAVRQDVALRKNDNKFPQPPEDLTWYPL